MLWSAFKEKMGKSESTVMHFDLPSLYGQNVDVGLFHQLEVPFSDEEIEGVVKELPKNKSPGPDGINNDFIKHCWHIVGKDMKDLIRAFYDENICMKAYMIPSFHSFQKWIILNLLVILGPSLFSTMCLILLLKFWLTDSTK